jgi:two-component system response regulator AtoC
LYYRINVIELRMPPLRERRADILDFVQYFLGVYSRMYGRTLNPLSPRLLHLLVMHHWPGNVRQLENLVRRYVVMNSEDAIAHELQRRDWAVQPDAPEMSAEAVGLKELTRTAVQEFERQMVLQALQANDGNRRKAARALGISYRALFYKMKAYRFERTERPQTLALAAGGGAVPK